MSWIRDALTAQGMGQSLTAVAVMGAGYDGGGIMIRYGIKVPSNVSKVTISTKVSAAPGVSASYELTGNNIDHSSGSVENDDVFVIDIPPGASSIVLQFEFSGVGYDIASGPMGSLTFDDVQVSDSNLQGNLLRFGSNNGVRIVNKAFADDGHFPIFGESKNSSVRSGVVSKNRKMNLGIA